MRPEEIEEKLITLETSISKLQHQALLNFQSFSPNSSIHSFHAYLGKNNNTFVDSVRTQFQSPSDFISQWISGLNSKLAQLKAMGKKGYNGKLLSEELILNCLLDPELRTYTLLFLERNFYRNFKERVRAKPSEELWRLWFGSGGLVWGLVIAPARRNDEWTNDKSQMRREDYDYWTLGHVMATGFIDPNSTEPMKFMDIKTFCGFYESILKRASNSTYEKGIFDRYLDYLRDSKNPLKEPLLIPELRYLGKEEKHEHRLDFTILNSHSWSKIGFELSPASTHISVSGIKTKTQAKLNEDLAEKWGKEMVKRREYFKKFGINTITFTDTDLKDLDTCFDQMRHFLMLRNESKETVETALQDLLKIHG